MREVETEFGTVTIGEDWVSVSAHGGQLWAWANRPGAVWPCSDLADLDEVRAGFDTGGFVDLDGDGDDVPSDELSAWSCDAIAAAGLPEDHPCHFVTVGQFTDRRGGR